jgi:tRNA pseudouridine55 synthase
MEEVLLIDKPRDWTSFDVVAKVRGGLKRKTGQKIKVGHAGTLDPFATGLLIVLIGSATKKQDEYMKKDKEYIATLELGKISSTGDPEGEISSLEEITAPPSREDIEKALKAFLGEIEQIPPRHSAVKINGQRAYTLARKGEDFLIKPRLVKIYKLELFLV